MQSLKLPPLEHPLSAGEEVKDLQLTVQELEQDITQKDLSMIRLSSEVQALQKTRAGLEGEIARVREIVVSEFQALLGQTRESIDEWGEYLLKVGRLEKEMVLAGYLAGDPEMLKEAPKEYPIILLQHLRLWIKMKGLDEKKHKLPDDIHHSYTLVNPELTVARILEWLERAVG